MTLLLPATWAVRRVSTEQLLVLLTDGHAMDYLRQSPVTPLGPQPHTNLHLDLLLSASPPPLCMCNPALRMLLFATLHRLFFEHLSSRQAVLQVKLDI